MIDIDDSLSRYRHGILGRRNRIRIQAHNGRYVRAVPYGWKGIVQGIAIDATLRARALGAHGKDAIKVKLRERNQGRLLVFAVDASDSMGTDTRMLAAKGAVLGLIRQAYQRRERLALVVFEGERARTILPATASFSLARERLRELTIGGATPLAHGLWTAWQLCKNERKKDPGLAATIVVITDGSANVCMRKGVSIWGELLAMGRDIRKEQIVTVFVDTNQKHRRSLRLEQLAKACGGRVQVVGKISAGALIEVSGGGCY